MCQYNITVISDGKQTVIGAMHGETLVHVLSENGFTVPAACGGHGTCGKCRVKVLDGQFDNDTTDGHGMIRSCRAKVISDAKIALDFEKDGGLTQLSGSEKERKNVSGIAFDIGTTTVAAAYIKKDGTILSTSKLNPQSAYGADVISRIEASANGKTEALCMLIRRCMNEIIGELCDTEPDEAVISGNTTMLHLFCGISPAGMGVYPFNPEFLDTRIYSGDELGLNVKKVVVLPSISAFVGSDIVSGIYAVSLHKKPGKAFLADLGTNGELVLSDNGKLYCTSTAAGPALEGACMECGIGGVTGAVDSVYENNGKTEFTVIGESRPTGICGAGIVDAISLMLKNGIIDETGAMDDERFYITDGIYISQNDIRQFQLAKSAVCSGIETLIHSVGLQRNDITSFFVAGGLGYYMNAESAFVSGIIPRISCSVQPVGNTSLTGALKCIGNEKAVHEMEKIAENCTHIDLGGNPEFNERFMSHMFFDTLTT